MNVPGYLPSFSPEEFDTFEDACEFAREWGRELVDAEVETGDEEVSLGETEYGGLKRLTVFVDVDDPHHLGYVIEVFEM